MADEKKWGFVKNLLGKKKEHTTDEQPEAEHPAPASTARSSVTNTVNAIKDELNAVKTEISEKFDNAESEKSHPEGKKEIERQIDLYIDRKVDSIREEMKRDMQNNFEFYKEEILSKVERSEAKIQEMMDHYNKKVKQDNEFHEKLKQEELVVIVITVAFALLVLAQQFHFTF